MVEVAIIGAGLAGIHCGLALQNQGLAIALFDKSRGIGGRLATRRIDDIPLDHGLASWQILGEQTATLTPQLNNAEILQPWRIAHTASPDPATWQQLPTTPAWMAPAGMTAIAKHLAQSLTIHRAHRLTALQPQGDRWQLTFDNGTTITARKVVLALPLPQILPLIAELSPIEANVNQITYAPALSLMLGYRSLNLDVPWQELHLDNHPLFQKIILDGQKRSPQTPTLVLQTHGTFTANYLDTDDLTPVTEILINAITQLFSLDDPQWSQIHRWRYAFPTQILGQPYLNLTNRLPLIACGDWCLGNGIEGAIISGLATASAIIDT